MMRAVLMEWYRLAQCILMYILNRCTKVQCQQQAQYSTREALVLRQRGASVVDCSRIRWTGEMRVEDNYAISGFS